MAMKKQVRRNTSIQTRGKYEVRLQGIEIPLTGSLNSQGKKQIAFTIMPNKWTSVHEDVYHMLVNKFDKPMETEVPDAQANEDHPHQLGEQPVMRTEQQQTWFLSFREKGE